MTENKRFTIKEIDNFNYGIKVTDVIMDDGIELPQSTVCDLLNGLSDENEQLKLISNHRGEMVSFATSLIQDMGSEEMLKIWNDFTEVMYQKWKKKRGIK